MRPVTIPIMVVALLLSACDGPDTSPTAVKSSALRISNDEGGFLHRVTVGSHDWLGAGVDANYSIAAIEAADGTTKGQWIDWSGHGNGGVHIDVDCLDVVGNTAWISGIAKGDKAFEGVSFITEVQDNGTSANDPPDQIAQSTYSTTGHIFDCHTHLPLQLHPLDNGEVKIE
jgi:hypothetical protein